MRIAVVGNLIQQLERVELLVLMEEMIMYNSAPPQGGYSNAQVGPPVGSDYYAAIAINKATGDWGWSTGFLGESVAIDGCKNAL